MKSPLLPFCLFLSIAGLLAMLTLKGAFDAGPGTDAFHAAQGVWMIGGLGYVLLGALFLRAPASAPLPVEED